MRLGFCQLVRVIVTGVFRCIDFHGSPLHVSALLLFNTLTAHAKLVKIERSDLKRQSPITLSFGMEPDTSREIHG